MIVRRHPWSKREPRVFVLQIGQVPILAFEAISTVEARELAKEEWFRSELLAARSGGQAVWDGDAHLEIGPAVGEQVDEVRNLLRACTRLDLPIVYLIKLDNMPQR